MISDIENLTYQIASSTRCFKLMIKNDEKNVLYISAKYRDNTSKITYRIMLYELYAN